MKYYIPLFGTINSPRIRSCRDSRPIVTRFSLLTYPVCLYISPSSYTQYTEVTNTVGSTTVQLAWKETWILHRIVAEILTTESKSDTEKSLLSYDSKFTQV